MIRFFLAFLFLFSAPLFADSNDLIITQPGDIFTDFTVEMYEDSSASMSFAEIQSLKNFTPHNNHISTGYSQSVFWFRFTLINKTDVNLTYFAEFTENFAHKVHGFITSEQTKTVIKSKQGVAYLNLEQSDELLKPKFQIDIKSGETKTVYLNIFGLYANFTSFNVIDMPTINQYELNHTGFYSVYFGAILAILFYNLTLYAFTKEIAYFYYTIYVASFLVWQLGNNGFFPFVHFSSSFTYYLTGLSIPIGLAFLLFFARTVLETKKLLVHHDSILKYFSYAYLLLAFAGAFFTHEAFILISFVTTAAMPFLLYTAFKSYRLGNKTALIFLVAQTGFLSMSTIFSLMTAGFLNYSLSTKHGLISAFLVEIFIFSLAIAYRIKKHEHEKLQLINQANLDLDQKVKERTSEIERSKKQLEDLASKDPLTNLYNRRFLYDISAELISMAKREKSPISLILFDIDDFKLVNDTFGHTIGDNVIIEFAKLLLTTRKCDVAARIGGEEFLLILPNTSEMGAFEIASQICSKVNQLQLIYAETQLSFTVSGGISNVFLDFENGIELAINRADQALYHAKENGKNQISIFNS